MEQILLKLAKQLAAYDEASLMALWDKYSEIVKNFEPTKRWEEAALIFSLIQAVRLKNQLFNQHWAESRAPAEQRPAPPASQPSLKPAKRPVSGPAAPAVAGIPAKPRLEPAAKKKGKLLSFPHKDEEKS